MRHDPERVAEVRAWLVKVNDDLRAGANDLAPVPPLTGAALFHAQQAAEKALKAFLTWHDLPFRRTHDLGEIGRQCVGIDESLEGICREAESLTVFAWLFRYPGDAEEPPPAEAGAGTRPPGLRRRAGATPPRGAPLTLLEIDLLHCMEAAQDGVPRRELLWLDPECQFKRLVSHLEPALLARDVQILRCEAHQTSGQLHLKLALLHLEWDPNARAVI